MKRVLFSLLGVLGFSYIGTFVIFACFQRRLIYFPSRAIASEEKMARIALPLGLEPWRDPQGVRIGWRQRPELGVKASHRIILFHGNAGSAIDRSQYVKGSALPFILHTSYFPPCDSPLRIRALSTLPGESIGSGPACALAADLPQKVAGVFLMTPFASLAEVGAHHYPWLPVKLLLRERWDNAAALRQFHGPVAIMIAAEDEVVTAAQSQKLFNGYTGPKRRWIDPDATHNTVGDSEDLPWWREVSDFLLENSEPR